jgi:hypothetical protein
MCHSSVAIVIGNRQRIAWALVGTQASTAVLSCVYFFAGPAIIRALVTILAIVGAIRKQRAAAIVKTS